jgi:predicted RNase H-like nuclease
VFDDDASMDSDRVLGVDACKAGWVGITLADGRVTGSVAATIGELVTAAQANGPLAVVAIDMPIGLPDQGRREADLLARQAIGALRSSVFMTPVRTALDAADHHAASARNRQLTGEGISIQAFGLRPKLHQVDRWVRETPCRVVEAHPEVSFAHLAGTPLTTRKHTWAGAHQRHRLLTNAAIPLDGDLGETGRLVAVDDILDAAACAWTARRVARGQARSLPDPPEVFSDGLLCAIWA